MTSHYVGIDFGTSTTLIAESSAGGRPAVVPIGLSTSWMPSVAAVVEQGLLTAEEALEVGPGRLISSVKQCITENRDRVWSRDGTVSFSADEVIVGLLSELARRARADGVQIGRAGTTRLGCPAMWDAGQRVRLLGLAEKAGFAVGPATLIDEPIAAGLNWVSEHSLRGEHLDEDRVLVFDMGGGTLDVALLDVTSGPGRDPEIYVLASEGVAEAGDAVDAAIASDLERKFNEMGVYLQDLADEPLARAHLQRAAVDAKIALTDLRETKVHVEYRATQLPALDYFVEELESAIGPQLERAWTLILSTLRAAYLTRAQGAVPSALRAMTDSELTHGVTHVLLAGGMSRVPAVANFLADRFPGARVHTFPNRGGQEAIAAGLANDSSYDQVNLHRPAFDFRLEYTDAAGRESSVLLYRAHTRFFASWEASTRDLLYYEWPNGVTAVAPEEVRRLPNHGQASLTVFALDGTHVPLRHKGENYESLKVDLGHKSIRFRLAPNGELQLFDGRGSAKSLRITRWPALKSGFAALALPIESPTFVPARRWYWDTK